MYFHVRYKHEKQTYFLKRFKVVNLNHKRSFLYKLLTIFSKFGQNLWTLFTSFQNYTVFIKGVLYMICS